VKLFISTPELGLTELQTQKADAGSKVKSENNKKQTEEFYPQLVYHSWKSCSMKVYVLEAILYQF
jgi:hypothetical protein